MKKKDILKEPDAPGRKGLTRREVLQKAGKAVYVVPVLVAIKQPPGKQAPGKQRPQGPGGSPPPPPG